MQTGLLSLPNMARRKTEYVIAGKIHAMRKAKGLTQEELAEQIGRAQSRVAKWELSEGVPPPKDLLSLSRVLGVPLEYLCDDDIENPGDVGKEEAMTPDEVIVLELARRIGADRLIKRITGFDDPPREPDQRTAPISVVRKRMIEGQ